MTISEKLKFIIKVKSMNSKEFASYIDVSESQLSRWLNEVNEPYLKTLRAICKKLDISYEDFNSANTPQELLKLFKSMGEVNSTSELNDLVVKYSSLVDKNGVSNAERSLLLEFIKKQASSLVGQAQTLINAIDDLNELEKKLKN